MKRVLEGPADCGNVFGFFTAGFVPAGKFVVVEDGEYSNGGYGPSVVVGLVFDNLEDAEDRCLGDDEFQIVDAAGTPIIHYRGTRDGASRHARRLGRLQGRRLYVRNA